MREWHDSVERVEVRAYGMVKAARQPTILQLTKLLMSRMSMSFLKKCSFQTYMTGASVV